MNRIEFERNTARETLQDAKNWLEDNDVRVKDIVVHELCADVFGAWKVVIYYERNA